MLPDCRDRPVGSRSSVPVLATLPLHRNAGGIPDLDPDRARTRPIGAVDPLGDDALGAKPASMSEHGRTVLGNVFIEQDASLDTPQQACQRGLAVEEWEISQILAVVLIRSKA